MAKAPLSFTSTSLNHPRGKSAKSGNPAITFRRVGFSASAHSSTAEKTETTEILKDLNCSSLYEVLGINGEASFREVKTAYRRLARVLHPDANGVDKDSSLQFIKVHEAYQTLSDPVKRADYDRSLFLQRGRFSRSSYVLSASDISNMAGFRTATDCRFSGYARRSWETDQCW